jgi:hypothetical protein
MDECITTFGGAEVFKQSYVTDLLGASDRSVAAIMTTVLLKEHLEKVVRPNRGRSVVFFESPQMMMEETSLSGEDRTASMGDITLGVLNSLDYVPVDAYSCDLGDVKTCVGLVAFGDNIRDCDRRVREEARAPSLTITTAESSSHGPPSRTVTGGSRLSAFNISRRSSNASDTSRASGRSSRSLSGRFKDMFSKGKGKGNA